MLILYSLVIMPTEAYSYRASLDEYQANAIINCDCMAFLIECFTGS
jgi:hypothetical protein